MRLIDADAWDVDLMTYGIGQAILGRKIKYTVGEVRSALAKRLTVEAVEVVRCKDCKHYWKNKPNDDIPVCLASPRDDAFCSEGERREDD